MAAVSHVTVLAAAARLQLRGILDVNHRYGITLGPAISGAPSVQTGSVPVKPVVAPATTQLITSDVLQGKYQPGAVLPSAKEMQRRYGVCRHTLKKALGEVVRMGLLHAVGRKYIVEGPPPQAGRSTIVLITPGFYFEELQYSLPRF
jgi:DNA-binding GntR family transcriptional regulator